jgi:hypothetical protein
LARLPRHARRTIPDHTEAEALGKFPGGESSINDFRSDPCRIAEGDENFRHAPMMDAGKRKRKEGLPIDCAAIPASACPGFEFIRGSPLGKKTGIPLG